MELSSSHTSLFISGNPRKRRNYANKGLEIHLSAIPVQTKEFSWTTSFNYSTNKNKLVALSNEEFQLKSGYIEDGWTGEPIQQYTHRIFEGGEVGNFYGFKTIDIDSEGRWIIEDKNGNPKPISEQQAEDKNYWKWPAQTPIKLG